MTIVDPLCICLPPCPQVYMIYCLIHFVFDNPLFNHLFACVHLLRNGLAFIASLNHQIVVSDVLGRT
jgi:hypothetical protein